MHANTPLFSPKLLLVDKPTVYEELRDDELIAACQKHDHLAFAVLYRKYKRFVYATLYRMAPDWLSSHDDMVQDVFMRVWGSLGTLKNPLAFKTWLNRLIANMFLDALRRRRVITISLDEAINDDDGQPSLTREIADTRNLPDEEFERKEVMQQVNTAVRFLPKQFAMAVVLREFDGLEYEQIAKLTKTSVGTVKSRIARGRAKIQTRLKALIA
jgi:RNA polymerase sigma-70 factor (ECF subfamily)